LIILNIFPLFLIIFSPYCLCVGIWGFQIATFVVGGLGLITGIAVWLILPGMGRVAGEGGLDLDGSLFGIHALRGMTGSAPYTSVRGTDGSFGSDHSSLNSAENDSYLLRTSLLAEKDGFY
jgi:hypothetical protein